ncbi:glycosyltransferase family 4 protein [Deinococcus sp. KNUC1210]|uniref:glycosyltransferase family 4 protein n=1 Tax=Deinococcus sp. KNUC1210 TaxID=2917691 RepID=UPI001EEFF6DC|nr:glycosyltransferase family 1 protein [Deinococcus sp. KNUC1210]ULH15299.1 glycosyltransferase family 4 protein [Deinococcus sp. KNUC1210]
MRLIYDERWIGDHGIGRFAREIRNRLPVNTEALSGENPVSSSGLLELESRLLKDSISTAGTPTLFFSPGYAPPILPIYKFAFTIHDLIHIDFPEESTAFKTLYYKRVVRPAIKRSQRVFTVSEYSKKRLLEWSGVDENQIEVVGNGVDAAFSPNGNIYQPGYPYILYVRNAKPHKNSIGLLRGFAQILDKDVKLILSGLPDDATRHEALRLGIYDRVVFAGRIPESVLPSYYRGAAVVTMPSLYEGFGLPALEGMASGAPVVVSNTTSLPEVVGNAGILVDPYDPESIAFGLEKALMDTELRQRLIRLGIERAALFNWDLVADKVIRTLNLENDE